MVRILFSSSLVFFLLAAAIVPGFAAPLPSGNLKPDSDSKGPLPVSSRPTSVHSQVSMSSEIKAEIKNVFEQNHMNDPSRDPRHLDKPLGTGPSLRGGTNTKPVQVLDPRRGPLQSWPEVIPKYDVNPPRPPRPPPPPHTANLESKNHAESSGSAQPPTKPSGSAHPGHPTLPSGSGTHNVPEHHPTLTPPSGSGTHPPTQPSGSANTPKTSKNAAKKLWGVMKSKFKRGGGAGSASG